MSTLLAHVLIVLYLLCLADGLNVHSLNAKSENQDGDVDKAETKQESGLNSEDIAGQLALLVKESTEASGPSLTGESAQIGKTNESDSSSTDAVLISQFYLVNRTIESVLDTKLENNEALLGENSELTSDIMINVNITVDVDRNDSIGIDLTNGNINNTYKPTDSGHNNIHINNSDDNPQTDNSTVDLANGEEELFTLGMDNVSSSNFSEENSNSTEALVNPITKDAQCPTCQIRKSDRQYRIESLKHQILRSLHITKPPNASGISIPKVPALTNLYESDSMMGDSPYSNNDEEYDDQFIVKTERVFTGAREAPDGLNLNVSDYVYFSPSVQLYTSHIKVTKLWLFIRKTEIKKPYVTLTVERILPESIAGKGVKTKNVLSIKIGREKAFGWRRIEFRDILREWVKHPSSNVGLRIRAEDEAGNNLVVLPPTPDVDKGYEPWLDSRIQEPRSNSRHRRSDSLVCSDNTTEARCCRYPLYVGFAEFGWEWIIAPTHVKADFCSGECRMSMQDQTPYGWIHSNVPGNTGSCCTPTKMSPLPLLYFDESLNIVYQILQNMKVDKCGCA